MIIMIKTTNERITITLTKKEVNNLNKLSKFTGFTKSVLIKQAISNFLYEQYKGRAKDINETK